MCSGNRVERNPWAGCSLNPKSPTYIKREKVCAKVLDLEEFLVWGVQDTSSHNSETDANPSTLTLSCWSLEICLLIKTWFGPSRLDSRLFGIETEFSLLEEELCTQAGLEKYSLPPLLHQEYKSTSFMHLLIFYFRAAFMLRKCLQNFYLLGRKVCDVSKLQLWEDKNIFKGWEWRSYQKAKSLS